MKPYEGFNTQAPAQRFQMLPAGTYVAAIKAVKIEGTEPDQQLVLRLEIVEGAYAGYYTKRYQHDAGGRFEARYKGDYRLQIPNQANQYRKHYDWDANAFNAAIYSITASNPGFVWDWDENKLIGKLVGINVREGTYNGASYTRIGRLEDVNAVRAGTVQTMPPMAARNDQPAEPEQPAAPQSFTQVNTDLPF